MKPRTSVLLSATLCLALSGSVAALAGCGSDDTETGAACDVVDDCYADLDTDDRDLIVGTIECMDRVEGGYCTHFCDTDADCCVAEGECDDDVPQVCAPFENSTQQRCFLSCESDVVVDADENEYCAEFAHSDFICRSTGGGSENRKVCVP
jgi:hypothetical protein